MFDKDDSGAISLDEIKENFGGFIIKLRFIYLVYILGARIPDTIWKEVI